MGARTILVVDNYDSFVYNLVQYLGELGARVIVRRNDQVGARDLAGLGVNGVLVSPGPGHPRDAGNCVEVIGACGERRLPMFGVCLGHQALGEAYGARVVAAPSLVPGRYHSLVVERATLPDCFEVTASTGDLVMGMRHRDLPLEGVQFHPESVLTQDGYRLLANWLARCGDPEALSRAGVLDEAMSHVRAALPTPSPVS